MLDDLVLVDLLDLEVGVLDFEFLGAQNEEVDGLLAHISAGNFGRTHVLFLYFGRERHIIIEILIQIM